MKKILFYYKSMNRFGGVERVIANTANLLAEKYSITILTKDTCISNYKIDSRIAIHSLSVMTEKSKNSSIKNILNCRQALKKYLKQNKFDYIYTATIIEVIELFACNMKLRNKIVATEHGSYFASNKTYNLIRKCLYRKIYKQIVFTKMDFIEYKKCGFPAIYIPHLLLSSVEENNQEKKKVVLNVGRLTDDKQQHLLIDIWEEICYDERLNEWNLNIVGSGENKNKLLTLLNKKKLTSRIFIYEATSNINLHYQESSIFAFTSKMEGFGMVLAEAMSYGLPCVSFDCPSGPRDIIVNGKNGYLVTCYDKKEFADKLKQIMLDSGKRTEMSNNAIDTIKKWNNEEIRRLFYEVFN